MEITLTPDIEQALQEQARQHGTTPEQLALDSLRQQFVHTAPSSQPQNGKTQGDDVTQYEGTLADLLADYIGVLHSGEYVEGGARMSEATGRAFAKLMVEKRKKGRL